MDPDEWFDKLREALPNPPAVAAADALEITALEREALLDLARVSAHTSERWTAPLSTFLAGVAFAATPSEKRTIALRAIVSELEG